MVFLFQILILVSVFILVVGLIKPKWILFRSKNPDRFWIMVIALLWFMASFTGYGELLRREKEPEEIADKPVFKRPAPSVKQDAGAPSPKKEQPAE